MIQRRITVARIPPVITTVPAVIRPAPHQTLQRCMPVSEEWLIHILCTAVDSRTGAEWTQARIGVLKAEDLLGLTQRGVGASADSVTGAMTGNSWSSSGSLMQAEREQKAAGDASWQGRHRSLLGVQAPSTALWRQAHPHTEARDLSAVPRAAPLPLRRKMPPRSPSLGCSAPPWLPRSAALDSARLPPSAGGPAGPREAALPAQALRALAGYPTLNLLAPPGGRGWGKVIGAGGSPARIPNSRGGLLLVV